MTDQERKQTMERQPLWATVALTVITVAGIAAITYIRLKTQDIPAGLIAVTSSAVTGVVMACGRRRV